MYIKIAMLRYLGLAYAYLRGLFSSFDKQIQTSIYNAWGDSVGRIAFKFNEQKAIESILYLAHNVKNPGVYVICKLLYLSDKVSLEKYGRFIFGETYCAMLKGATPSTVYDLFKNPSIKSKEAFRKEGNSIIPKRKPNLEYLSDSDIECLENTAKKYNTLPNRRKMEDAHDEAWRRSWGMRGTKKSNLIPIESIAEQFPDSKDIIDYITNVG